MPSPTLRAGCSLLVMAAVFGGSRAASAHIRWTKPAPRSQDDGLKAPEFPAPCGKVSRGPTRAVVAQPGGSLNVQWTETIGHKGCFQIAFSADDTSFVLLKQIDDLAGGAGMLYNDTVTLPAGVTCSTCTLQLRQIMLDGQPQETCAPNATPPSGVGGNTYYSCSDLCVGPDCPSVSSTQGPDAGTADLADAAPTTVPTDGGGKFVDGGGDGGSANPSSADPAGCSLVCGSASGISSGVALGLFGIALARRRRHRR